MENQYGTLRKPVLFFVTSSKYWHIMVRADPVLINVGSSLLCMTQHERRLAFFFFAENKDYYYYYLLLLLLLLTRQGSIQPAQLQSLARLLKYCM